MRCIDGAAAPLRVTLPVMRQHCMAVEILVYARCGLRQRHSLRCTLVQPFVHSIVQRSPGVTHDDRDLQRGDAAKQHDAPWELFPLFGDDIKQDARQHEPIEHHRCRQLEGVFSNDAVHHEVQEESRRDLCVPGQTGLVCGFRWQQSFGLLVATQQRLNR